MRLEMLRQTFHGIAAPANISAKARGFPVGKK